MRAQASVEAEPVAGAPQPGPRDDGAGYAMDERRLGSLMSALSKDTSLLVRQETELFKREMEARIDRVETHATVLGAGAVIGYVGLLALSAALILGLAELMAPWLAAGLVGVGYAIAGGVAFARGKSKLEDEPMTPRHTHRNVQRDARTIREAAR